MTASFPNLSSVQQSDLERLVNEIKPQESRSLEYKASTDFRDQDKQKRLLKTLSAFANGRGGDILFGIEAIDGVPERINPLQNFNVDSEILRLDALIRTHIQPRLFGVQFQAVPISGLGHVFIIRVPKSWSGPHMLMFGENRFYIRDGNGNRPMDFTDVSLAFTENQQGDAKVNSVRFERCASVLSEDVPVYLNPTAQFVIQLIPLESLVQRSRIDIAHLFKEIDVLRPIAGETAVKGFNVDGCFTWTSHSNNMAGGYVFLMKSGIIESVVANLAHTSFDERRQKYIHLSRAEVEMVDKLQGQIKFLIDHDIQPPFVVCLSILNCKDYLAVAPEGVNRLMWYESVKPIKQKHIHIEPVVIEKLDADFANHFEPTFASAWRACGLLRSPNYNQERKWIHRR